ncbi:MAG: hypothetical protein FJ298_08245 [Planctomycetes bacterium]|nr:hypothetical protein [Planctomycetota bacterium]
MKPLVALALGLGLTACGSERARDATPGSAPAPKIVVAPSDTLRAGTLRGYVHLIGEAPTLPPMALGASDGCGTLRASAPSERLLVADTRIANVLLRVKSGPAASNDPAPSEPVVLDQRGCVFVPHVVVVRVGQPLALRNSDEFVHNVNVRSIRNQSSNRSIAPRDPDVHLRFEREERSIAVRCDLHPWMQAIVHVVDTPHVALTGSDGTFELTGLAPGDYEFELLHEWLGRVSLRATIGSDHGVEARIGLRVPTR